jgi:hypothetical protein
LSRPNFWRAVKTSYSAIAAEVVINPSYPVDWGTSLRRVACVFFPKGRLTVKQFVISVLLACSFPTFAIAGDGDHGASATGGQERSTRSEQPSNNPSPNPLTSPSARRAPIAFISHQVDNERVGWQWTQVEGTNDWHWQRDVKITDDNMSRMIHDNSDNHRIQVGEPWITAQPHGGYILRFYVKHDRKKANPIVEFTIGIKDGSVQTIATRGIRKAGALGSVSKSLAKYGLKAGAMAADFYVTRGVAGILASAAGYMIDGISQYDGWELDASWFALQIGWLYARALPE